MMKPNTIKIFSCFITIIIIWFFKINLIPMDYADYTTRALVLLVVGELFVLFGIATLIAYAFALAYAIIFNK